VFVCVVVAGCRRMTVQYKIVSYDRDKDGDTQMIFQSWKGQQVTVNLQQLFPEYCPVQDSHYIDQGGKLVSIFDCNRVVCIIDDHVYQRASQFDLDRSESINYPHSDNAKVFRYLQELWSF